MSRQKLRIQISKFDINHNKAFSLIELSIVILVIGILISAIAKGGDLLKKFKITAAQSLTKSSNINSIPDLKLWLEPTLKSSITSINQSARFGDLISSWNDIRVVSNSEKINLSQPDSARQPEYVQDGIGGLPSLKFENNDMLFNNDLLPLELGDDSYTLVAVFDYDFDDSSNRWVMGQGPSSATNSRSATIYVAANGNILLVGWNNDFRSSVYANQDRKPFVVIGTINNSYTKNAKLYINSNIAESGSSNNVAALNLAKDFFSVGNPNYTSGIRPYLGLISEIMVFDRDLEQDEIEIINEYVNQKYGIKIKLK